MQSQLADAQDEAQLLRRLLTLCNQALDTDARAQAALAAAQEEQQLDSGLSTSSAEHAKVCTHGHCPVFPTASSTGHDHLPANLVPAS